MIVIDDSSVSIGKAPNGGFVVNLQEITGLPSGLTILIPFEGAHAQEVYEGISEALGHTKKVDIAGPVDLQTEVKLHGLDPSI